MANVVMVSRVVALAALVVLWPSRGSTGNSAAATIRVIASDYAFTAPEKVPAGIGTFTLENRGDRLHEMFIGLMKPGTSASRIAEAHRRNVNFRELSNVYLEGGPGVALFAWPRSTSPASASLDLVRGREYILLCQLRDSIGAPQHAALGMFRVIRVE